MSFKKRIKAKASPQQRTPMRGSATSMKHIAYLMRTNPNIKTEKEAKLFLTKVQREHPKESIHVTKEGRVFSVSQTGMISDIGKDGRVIRSFPRTSSLAKNILTHYEITYDGIVTPRKTEATADSIYHLIGTNPKLKTERDAELLLNELQKQRPNETIHVTEEGRILSRNAAGIVTDLGSDGKTAKVYPATSDAAKKARALFPHYADSKTKDSRRIP
ncbi:hypothetical protein [[Eubacterium] cellulosolvens]